MRKKNYKGRCEKQTLEKFTTVCKTYDPIQSAYANILVKNKDVAEVRCNVPLDGDECGEYMTDFVCKKTDGDLMVRECIRYHQTKPDAGYGDEWKHFIAIIEEFELYTILKLRMR